MQREAQTLPDSAAYQIAERAVLPAHTLACGVTVSSRSLRAVLAAYCHSGQPTGALYPSKRTIAERASLSLPTVKRAVRALVELGVLEHCGKRSVHRVLVTQYRINYRRLWGWCCDVVRRYVTRAVSGVRRALGGHGDPQCTTPKRISTDSSSIATRVPTKREDEEVRTVSDSRFQTVRAFLAEHANGVASNINPRWIRSVLVELEGCHSPRPNWQHDAEPAEPHEDADGNVLSPDDVLRGAIAVATEKFRGQKVNPARLSSYLTVVIENARYDGCVPEPTSKERASERTSSARDGFKSAMGYLDSLSESDMTSSTSSPGSS